MRLELAERLRCPRPHVPTPLIVVAQETRDRALRRAIVGCAVCGLEARIVDGALILPPTADAAPDHAVASVPSAAHDVPVEVPSEAALERLVALLHLDVPGGAILLAGRYAGFADGLEADRGVTVAVLARDASPTSPRHVAGVAGAIPFTDATFRAAAVDALARDVLADLPRVVAPGGRLVGPAATDPPGGARLLARDAREWVGASEGPAGRPVGIGRRIPTDGG